MMNFKQKKIPRRKWELFQSFMEQSSLCIQCFNNVTLIDDNGVVRLARDVFSAFIENLKEVVEKTVQEGSDISWRFIIPDSWGTVRTYGEAFIGRIASKVRCGLVLKYTFENL